MVRLTEAVKSRIAAMSNTNFSPIRSMKTVMICDELNGDVLISSYFFSG